MGGTRRWLVAPLLGTAIAGAARRRGALSPSGAVGAAGVGTAVFGAAGLRGSALLLLFFGSSTALSRLTPDRSSHRVGCPARSSAAADAASPSRDEGVPGPQRTLVQVLANGGIPAALAIYNHLRPSPRLDAAYAGALAAANADTWATEIGALSRAKPRLITSGRPMPRGVSGAVTPLGTLASLIGALVIGCGYAVLAGQPGAVPRLGAAGFVGSLADSILGATAQAVYTCRACGQRTEDRTHRHGTAPPDLTLERGLPLMTNDTVNLCASMVGAVAGTLLYVKVKGDSGE